MFVVIHYLGTLPRERIVSYQIEIFLSRIIYYAFINNSLQTLIGKKFIIPIR